MRAGSVLVIGGGRASVGLALAAGALACAVEGDDPPQGDESGTTASQSAEEQQAECEEAVESSDSIACPGGTSFLFQQGGDVAEWVVVSIDEVRIDLPHGYLLEASGEDVLIGEIIVHNDQCFAGCLFSDQPGSDVCVGTDAEGNVLCQSVGDTDVETCEMLTEACAG